MTDDTPKNARLAARVLLLDGADRLLLMQAQDEKGKTFWVMPGGGLADGEGFSDAARRELFEETGLAIGIGPCIWHRRHIFQWNGNRLDQYERFFVATTADSNVRPVRPDSYVVGHRWWTMAELTTSNETFAPRRLPLLLPPIIRGDYPDVPFDCGL